MLTKSQIDFYQEMNKQRVNNINESHSRFISIQTWLASQPKDANIEVSDEPFQTMLSEYLYWIRQIEWSCTGILLRHGGVLTPPDQISERIDLLATQPPLFIKAVFLDKSSEKDTKTLTTYYQNARPVLDEALERATPERWTELCRQCGKYAEWLANALAVMINKVQRSTHNAMGETIITIPGIGTVQPYLL